MKVSIGKYRYRYSSDIHERYMNRKYGYYKWEDSCTWLEIGLERFQGLIQGFYNKTINIGIDSCESQKVKVRIDPWDTWSLDHTLSHIVLPMLVQLKETKHGSPCTDDEDAPQELGSTKGPKEDMDCEFIDSNHHLRWDYIIDEMIWSFEQKTRDHWESDYYEYEDDLTETDPKEYSFGLKLVWEDREGSKAHADRMRNGFRLFGKYYENLWD